MIFCETKKKNMVNHQRELIQNILEYIGNFTEANCSKRSLLTLIKVHTESLRQFGEFSFAVKREIWFQYEKLLTENGLQLLAVANDHDKVDEKFAIKFLETARQWSLPIQSLLLLQGRYHIYLQRINVIKEVLGQILTDSNYGYLQKSDGDIAYVHQLNVATEGKFDTQNLSHYRALLLRNTLQRLLAYSKWIVINDEAELINLIENVTYFQVYSVMLDNPEELPGKTVKIKCGLVTDPAVNKKIAKLSTDEYQRLRSNDMSLMMLHKYGVRVKQDEKFRTIVEHLGTAAVTVDLMEVKHSSPVKIIRSGQGGNSKGVSFILYNSARIETLLRTFEKCISNGTYESLPNFNCINCEYLTEEEEWQMVFVYLLGFPNLIECCLEQLNQGHCAVHLIIRFLQGLVRVFSVYYRKTKILMQRRDHLMPLVYARIYFIKAIRIILNNTLALLDINPIDFM